MFEISIEGKPGTLEASGLTLPMILKDIQESGGRVKAMYAVSKGAYTLAVEWDEPEPSERVAISSNPLTSV